MDDDEDNLYVEGIEKDCVGCEYYNAEEDYCTMFICDGWGCPVLPCEE